MKSIIKAGLGRKSPTQLITIGSALIGISILTFESMRMMISGKEYNTLFWSTPISVLLFLLLASVIGTYLNFRMVTLGALALNTFLFIYNFKVEYLDPVLQLDNTVTLESIGYPFILVFSFSLLALLCHLISCFVISKRQEDFL